MLTRMAAVAAVETGEAYPLFGEFLPPDPQGPGRYVVRFARNAADLDAVLRLRYEVFNLELGEGLDSSRETGRDLDAFDARCHHLIVEDAGGGGVVGTYRMMTSAMAGGSGGLYSAGEFDLGALPREVIEGGVEVGRACVARPHRNRQVLFHLWSGLALYLRWNRKRYLFGCCSLTSQDPEVGRRAHAFLESGRFIHPGFAVRPLPGFECDGEGWTRAAGWHRGTGGETRPAAVKGAPDAGARLPILFTTYLRYGAKVCGPPAIDRAFRTIDFLTLLDVASMDADQRKRFFPEGAPTRAAAPSRAAVRARLRLAR